MQIDSGKITSQTIIITILKGFSQDLSDQINKHLKDGGDVTYMNKVVDEAEYEKWLVAIKKDWDKE